MTLKEKISQRKAVVGVIGLGYVGLPLAVEKAKAGYTVIGFDIQPQKVRAVNRAENYIGDVLPKDLDQVIMSNRLQATSDFTRISECDVIAICVPTPLDQYQKPDLSCVENSAKEIAKNMRNYTLVILESTTYPGTTEMLKPILESAGKKVHLAFSPERVDPGNKLYNTKNTPKVVGGIDAESSELAKILYENVLDAEVLVVSSPREAEMAKILENTFRLVNISLINELAILANKMNINIWEVIEAASTKPFGFMPFYPGVGAGGHCIPIDPYYLSFIAKRYHFPTRMVDLAGEINEQMPAYVVDRLSELLNTKKKCLNGARILVVGVAYKPEIDDVRASPAIRVMEILREKGAEIIPVDPYVKSFELDKTYFTETITKKLLDTIDAAIITTAHKKVDYDLICNYVELVLDTKNITKRKVELL